MECCVLWLCCYQNGICERLGRHVLSKIISIDWKNVELEFCR